jgi:hypothetical protein
MKEETKALNVAKFKEHSLQKRKQTKIVGANNREILLRYLHIVSLYHLVSLKE